MRRTRERGSKRVGKRSIGRKCVHACVHARTAARQFLIMTSGGTTSDVMERLMEKRGVLSLGHHLDPRYLQAR